MNISVQRCLENGLYVGTIALFLGVYLSVSLIGFGAILTLLCGVCYLVTRRNYQLLFHHPLGLPIFLVSVAILVSIVFAEPYPFSKSLEKVGYLLFIFPLTAFFAKRQSFRAFFLKASLVLSVLLFVVALLQLSGCLKDIGFTFLVKHSKPIPFSDDQLFLATGFTFHHTPFGASATWLFHILWAQALFCHSRRQKLIYFGGAFLCAGAALCSFSRGVWLSLFLSAIFVTSLFDWRRALGILSLFSGVTSLLFFNSQAFRRRLSAIQLSSNTERVELWKLALKMFRDSPWVGQGFHSFGHRLQTYAPERFKDAAFPKETHNMYLDFLSGTGVLGFSAFLFFSIRSLWLLVKTYLGCSESDPNKPWVLTTLGGFTAFLIAGMFDRHFFMVQTLVPTLLFLSLASAIMLSMLPQTLSKRVL